MDDNYRKAIEREARLLNSLKHVALPRVTDHFLEENVQFLVMEFIAGEDLAHHLETTNKPFPVDTVLTWADQLLDALNFLHNQVNPVIHRDIKPQNLKVTPNGQIILLDFGLAKGNPTDAGHQTAAKSIFGYSRNYASLEQIQGTGTDPRSDLYSLAATLYHLLTDHPPEDALTRAMAVLSHHPDPLVPANKLVPEIPAGVAGVLQKALALNAAQRPSTASEMRTMLREHEKHTDLVPDTAAIAAPPGTEIYSQQTKILPGATVQFADRPTDVKTEVMPGPVSQVTAMKGSAGDTSSRPKRRFAAVGLIALLLAGSMLGGAYLFSPSMFADDSESPPVSDPAAPTAVETKAIAESSNSNVNAAADASASSGASAEVTTDPASARPPEPRNDKAAQQSAAAKPPRTKPDEIIVDGETVYMGNTKITPDGTIETPDHIIDENGVTPRRPMPPNTRPVVIPPIDMRYMTPRQRRRLQETLRRHQVTMAPPTPTPEN
jgi:serine/threonine protein kinase